MLKNTINAIPLSKSLFVFCIIFLPNISFSQKEINLHIYKLNQKNDSNTLALVKEIEVEHRDLMIAALKKTSECINNALTIGMISICKSEEATEKKSINKIKQEMEKFYLKKSSVK